MAHVDRFKERDYRYFTLFKYGNTTVVMVLLVVKTQLQFIHLPLNPNNINPLEPATFRALIVLN